MIIFWIREMSSVIQTIEFTGHSIEIMHLVVVSFVKEIKEPMNVKITLIRNLKNNLSV